VLREERLVPKFMNEYQIASTMERANIYATHWKKVVQCLRTFQDVKGPHFATEDKVRILGGAYINMKTGVSHYEKKKGEAKERVKYWYKDASEEFLSSIESIMNSKKLDPKEIEWINHCAGGDHTDVKFRFLAKSIVKTVKGKYYVVRGHLQSSRCWMQK